MRRRLLIVPALFILFGLLSDAHSYESLLNLYNQASPSGRYTKYIELDSTLQYTGDLMIPSDQYVYINGHGAIIFNPPAIPSIYVGINSNLDIERCIFVGGLMALNFAQIAGGTINNNTIVGCREQSIYCDGGYNNQQLNIWNNIICDAMFAVYCIDSIPGYTAYNDLYNIDSIGYALYCPT
jgi:hypothetical protein